MLRLDKLCAKATQLRFVRRSLTASLAGLVFAGLTMHGGIAAETKTFVISWFYIGSYNEENDCKEQFPLSEVWIRKIALEQGVPLQVVEKEFLQFNPLDEKGPVPRAIIYRGRVNGKPANVYANPGSVPDPNMPLVTGRYALGFNLDGKGADDPSSFEDPYTHEKGVDNEMFRALGCIPTERATPPGRPNFPIVRWDLIRDTMPAWLISITGEDLSKDGPVTVAFDRALEHVGKDAAGEVLSDSTFRINPNPRFHHTAPGKIEKGMLTTTAPFNLTLLSNQFFMPELHFRQALLRLKLEAEGASKGILGGYLPWRDVYWPFPMVGFQGESMVGYDVAGIYHALKKLADAEPDPKTGQNNTISTGWWVEAVPAFAVKAKTQALVQ